MSVFDPGLLELCIYGRINDPGMGPYCSRVRRDFDVASGATFAADWLHWTRPTRNPPVGLGFLHSTGQYRSLDVRFRPRVVESKIRGWNHIAPGCGEISTLFRGETLHARGLHELLPIWNQSVGLGIPHLAGRYRPGGRPFLSPVDWSCRYMECSNPGMAPYPLRVWRNPDGSIQHQIF